MNRNDLEPIEKASVDELCGALQLRASSAVAHAYQNVPHYRKKFDAAGVHPDDLRRWRTLGRFRFTTKADLRETYPFSMFAVPMERIVRVHASSGTTGKPTVVGYTRNDIEMWSGVMARSIRAAGGRVESTRSTSPTATASSPGAWRALRRRGARRDGDPWAAA